MDRSVVRHARAVRHRAHATLAIACLAAAAAGAALLWRCTGSAMSACEREVRHGDRRRAVELCRDSHARTGDHRDLVWAARAHLYLGQLDEAGRLAGRLAGGPRYGDAHGILSYLALRRGALAAATLHATLARVAHRLAGDERGLASAAVSLSQAAWRAGDFTAALDAADEALRLAPRLDDSHGEVVAHLARADALRRMGDTRSAAATLQLASERASEPCDRAWTRLKRGMCLMEAGHDALALADLRLAADANRVCGSRDVASQIAINQAWLLRRRDPPAALATLDDTTRADGECVETLLLRGYLAADRGALAEADRYLDAAASLEPPDADWPWEIVRARAELAELRGGAGDALAEVHYRRATAMIASLRVTARARSAHLVASHRGPYDGLIALLARAGRWRDVLAVVLELDASDMLRATADEVLARDRAASPVDSPPPRATPAPPVAVDAVLAAWRSRDLVVVIAPSRRQIGPGRERAYRLRISAGEVTGEDIGDAGAARSWATDLFADPDDRRAARALGRMFVPIDHAATTLHVLAIGSLGKVPLAALRDDHGALLIARRPLVRVLALAAASPEAHGAGPAVVIADPRGDLPRAGLEGAMVARALGPGAQLSGSGTPSQATRARLWDARDAALLHFAGHVGEAGRWRALQLADGAVAPAELVQRGLAPRIAVLAGCGSAAATDEEGWGSIAAALLQSGTAVVIATDRSVDDRTALSLMLELYAQPDWRSDPPRALARVQHALDLLAASSDHVMTRARSWAAFSVLARPPVVHAASATR